MQSISGFVTPVIIAIVIMVFSHLSQDRDFPDTMKTGAYVVLGIITFLYIIFGIL